MLPLSSHTLVIVDLVAFASIAVNIALAIVNAIMLARMRRRTRELDELVAAIAAHSQSVDEALYGRLFDGPVGDRLVGEEGSHADG